MLSSWDQSHDLCRRAKPKISHGEKPGAFINVRLLPVSQGDAAWPTLLLNLTPSHSSSRHGLTCASSCSGPAPPRTAALSAAGGCWSRGPGPWQWSPSGLSPAPAHTRWNLGWRKYCALPAMRNKEINKKAKAPLMRRSAQLDYNRLQCQGKRRVNAGKTQPLQVHTHILCSPVLSV